MPPRSKIYSAPQQVRVESERGTVEPAASGYEDRAVWLTGATPFIFFRVGFCGHRRLPQIAALNRTSPQVSAEPSDQLRSCVGFDFLCRLGLGYCYLQLSS